jgi:hypothetical protein
MSTKYNLLLLEFILLGCLLQGYCTKRIYVKQAADGSSSARQRIREATNNIGLIRHEFPQLNGASFEVPDDFDIESFQGDPRFEHVEEVPQGSAALVIANDARLSEQWALPNVQMSEVWDLVHWDQTRLKNISLAICDSGFTFDHPDLDASRVIWQYNYVSDNYNTTDDHYHGTHVAGIAAATTNNSVGVAGIAHGVNFMIGKVLAANGIGYYDDWIKCIVDTTDRGTNIINLSLGGTASSTGLEQAVNYATQKGVLVVAAAGNTYNDGNGISYPGAIANSFSVANLNTDGTRSPSSTTNSFVDIAAPGTSILNTLPASRSYYGYLTGTSMATPLVAGVAALMMAAKPGTTAQQVRELLQNTAIDLGTAGKDNEFGYGKVNPLQAVKELLNVPPVISVGSSYELVLNQAFSLTVTCSATESFDSCASLSATNVPSFMTVTQVSAAEIKIDATATMEGSSQVTFNAVDTFSTSANVQVTFTAVMVATPVSVTPEQGPSGNTPDDSASPSYEASPEDGSATPANPGTKTPSTISGSGSPGSKVAFSSASQSYALGFVFSMIAVFAWNYNC